MSRFLVSPLFLLSQTPRGFQSDLRKPRRRRRRDVGGDDARFIRVARRRTQRRTPRRLVDAANCARESLQESNPHLSVFGFFFFFVGTHLGTNPASADVREHGLAPPRGAQQRRQRRRRVSQIRRRGVLLSALRFQDVGVREHCDGAFEEASRAESLFQRLYGLEVAGRDPTGRVEHQQKHIHSARRIDAPILISRPGARLDRAQQVLGRARVVPVAQPGRVHDPPTLGGGRHDRAAEAGGEARRARARGGHPGRAPARAEGRPGWLGAIRAQGVSHRRLSSPHGAHEHRASMPRVVPGRRRHTPRGAAWTSDADVPTVSSHFVLLWKMFSAARFEG